MNVGEIILNVNGQKLNLVNSLFFHKGVNSMNSKSSKTVDSYIGDIIKSLKESDSAANACKVLEDAVKEGNLTVKNGVLYKHNDYTIQNMLKIYGEGYKNNLQKIDKLGLEITPEYIDTVEKQNELFIVTKLAGAANDDLIPYRQVKDKVSDKDKLAAFKDLQKLTKAGFVDDAVLNGNGWFVVPATNKIMLPVWQCLRPLQKHEAKAVLEQYYNIIFK